MSSSCVVIDTRAVPTARVFGHTSSTACQKPSARSATASSGADRKPTPLEVEEQFPPGLRALAHALDEADELLFALRCGADDDQQALRVVLWLFVGRIFCPRKLAPVRAAKGVTDLRRYPDATRFSPNSYFFFFLADFFAFFAFFAFLAMLPSVTPKLARHGDGLLTIDLARDGRE